MDPVYVLDGDCVQLFLSRLLLRELLSEFRVEDELEQEQKGPRFVVQLAVLLLEELFCPYPVHAGVLRSGRKEELAGRLDLL